MILPSKSDTTHIETHFDTTGRAEADAFISEIEADGAKASEVLAEIAVKAESANQSSGELAARVKALEEALPGGLPLVVWWDGTGVRPALQPGWLLINTTTGVVERE